MALQLKPALSTEERVEKRRLILHDTVSLFGLFVVTAFLFVLTYLLFRSFTDHRQELAQRWVARGEQALANGDPKQAVNALHSALAYDPGSRKTEIELATALAEAGRIQEAQAYFNTLWEAEPGNAMINLQLARLSVQQNNEQQALQYYQAALDGTWQGDGYIRRREVRLELARYLIARHDYAAARTHLLIAAGNSPDDPKIKLEIAGLLEQAQDPSNAFEIYRTIAQKHHAPVEALEGAGRTAFELGHYLSAKQYLDRAMNSPPFARQPDPERMAVRNLLADAAHILLLFPSPDLPVKARAQRILNDAGIARVRLASCSNPAPLTALAARWAQLPQNLTTHMLESDPQLEQTTMQLVYDTEQQTMAICGNPTGDDALLLKIAQTPWAVEQPL